MYGKLLAAQALLKSSSRSVLPALVAVLTLTFGWAFWPPTTSKAAYGGLVLSTLPVLWLISAGIVAAALRLSRQRQLSRFDLKDLLEKIDGGGLRAFLPEIDIREPGKIRFQGVLPPRYFYRTPTSAADVRVISEINSAAFGSTPYAGSTASKYKRNLAMWEKLPEAFQVIDCPMADANTYAKYSFQPLFFSCIFPLTQNGFDGYFVQRRRGDIDFDADWIAQRPSEAHSILVFTIAKRHSFAEMPSLGSSRIASECLRAATRHLQLLYTTFFAGRDVHVYLQNKDPTFQRLMPRLGFVATPDMRSRDDETVYALTIKP